MQPQRAPRNQVNGANSNSPIGFSALALAHPAHCWSEAALLEFAALSMRCQPWAIAGATPFAQAAPACLALNPCEYPCLPCRLTSAAMRVRRPRAICARALRVPCTSERPLPLAASDVLAQRTRQQAGRDGFSPSAPPDGVVLGLSCAWRSTSRSSSTPPTSSASIKPGEPASAPP